MSAQDFKYDVAFSFLAQDEVLAMQLADQFEGRLRVFLYSRKQEQLAGTDGERHEATGFRDGMSPGRVRDTW